MKRVVQRHLRHDMDAWIVQVLGSWREMLKFIERANAFKLYCYK
jgi:hypothetical protein